MKEFVHHTEYWIFPGQPRLWYYCDHSWLVAPVTNDERVVDDGIYFHINDGYGRTADEREFTQNIVSGTQLIVTFGIYVQSEDDISRESFTSATRLFTYLSEDQFFSEIYNFVVEKLFPIQIKMIESVTK